jgi:cephalosporin hydroxylase
MVSLQSLDNPYTDKNTKHSYLPVYDALFTSVRESAKAVLEIGIQRGGSLGLWRDYFPTATIYGIDIADQITAPGVRGNERIVALWGDAYDPTFVRTELTDKSTRFDIIIDDGPHTLESMVAALSLYIPLLVPGGIIVIEDVRKIKWISHLRAATPIKLREHIEVHDLRTSKGRFDDILFVIRHP